MHAHTAAPAAEPTPAAAHVTAASAAKSTSATTTTASPSATTVSKGLSRTRRHHQNCERRQQARQNGVLNF